MTTIYHNPRCSKSRNALTILTAAGEAPEVVEYLKTGWTRDQLEALFAQAGITARDALRKGETVAKELGLADADEGQILDAMVQHSILVERPIVTSPKGTALCRPMSNLLPLLAQPVQGPILDGSGKVLVDEKGNAL
ncbi:arsenate reductase (glutaredoxin) [Donghicola sp. C2-DW-16]|uniref:Arsenate reductase n=1 Tax=Donghicola mangrovi TaxID=2729614 RepID=A0ABX2PFS4_9RHOB|nr:arsenate reductase (glutaredoxin) [Donghicola mangrovi]NVO28343.1 arsenate reductase (glutaredoxin) [Donghicola mangrovi]